MDEGTQIVVNIAAVNILNEHLCRHLAVETFLQDSASVNLLGRTLKSFVKSIVRRFSSTQIYG